MNYWIFKVFESQRGVDVIGEWLNILPLEAKVQIKRRFAYLATLKKEDWRRPLAAKLKGEKYDPIWEIIIKWNKIQYRPLGCFGPEEDNFTLLIGAIERSTGIFEPRNAPETAKARCNLIHKDRRFLGEYS